MDNILTKNSLYLRALRLLAAAIVCCIPLMGFICTTSPGFKTGNGQWLNWGGDIRNTHNAVNETMITPENVHLLEPKWIYNTGGSVSAIPTVIDDTVYVTDWGPVFGGVFANPRFPGGSLHAVDRWSGNAIWRKPIGDYNPDTANNISRSSPAIAGDLLIFGDQLNFQGLIVSTIAKQLSGNKPEPFPMKPAVGAHMYAVNRHTGELVWKTKVGELEWDIITQSPTVYGNKVFIGVSTQESALAKDANFPCCKFRGSFMALDLQTGAILWRIYTVPDNHGALDQYSGAAVWGSSPSIDVARNQVYIPTGNNYWVPKEIQDCILEAGSDTEAQELCTLFVDEEDNHFDSILALDIDTGEIKWNAKPLLYDPWNLACDHAKIVPLLPGSSANCTKPKGPDADFAQAPMLINVDINGTPTDILAVGQKNGAFWALNPNNGNVIWVTQVGPLGFIGGMEFGSATDGQRIFLQNSNSNHQPYTLTTGPNAGKIIDSGFWAALDAATGQILWETPVPAGELPKKGMCNAEGIAKYGAFVCVHPAFGFDKGPGFFSWAVGPLTHANGVVFAGASDLKGTIYAMHAQTGEIIWSYETGQSSVSAPSVVDGRLYWGVGYKYGVEGTKLYSFGLPLEMEKQLLGVD